MINALRKLVHQLLQSKYIEACLHENEKTKKAIALLCLTSWFFMVKYFSSQVF